MLNPQVLESFIANTVTVTLTSILRDYSFKHVQLFILRKLKLRGDSFVVWCTNPLENFCNGRYIRIEKSTRLLRNIKESNVSNTLYFEGEI